MKYADFAFHFSAARTGRYLHACSNNKRRCVKLYKANLLLAQSFHPLLGMLEVALRNGIHEQLSLLFNDPDWIVNQKSGFMVHPNLTYINKRTGRRETNRFLLNAVTASERKLGNRAILITSGKIIAEQVFGFWTDLFENHHYKILRGRPIKIFPNLPSGYGRTQVLQELSKVRQFRNRINHNEPVCFNGNNIDLSQTMAVYQSILALLKWINPELVKMAKGLDRVPIAISKTLSV